MASINRNLATLGLAILGMSLEACSAAPGEMSQTVAAEKPKLILQITVDGLRGDMLKRYSSVLGEDGFNRILYNGVVYEDANFEHANTLTIVGHASLATGAPPAHHGMVGNVWYDRTDDRLFYNIEDPDYQLLAADAGIDQETEIDPTQRAARSEGRSPKAMLGSTFGDQLSLATNGAAKVFAVSVKDRGAVALAGQSGKAFWFSKRSGEFITSTYYYDQMPEWVGDWHKAGEVGAYTDQNWTLLLDVQNYTFGGADDRFYEINFQGFGRTFPHAYGSLEDRFRPTKLTLGPAGDELTASFAKAIIRHESLGADEITDYLAVSFSSTDYVGHLFGASSLETEDNLAQLDRTIGDLLSYLDTEIGLDNVLIVLSSDHGQPEVPAHLRHLHVLTSFYFDQGNLEVLDDALLGEFGVGSEIVSDYFPPYVYLNEQVIRDNDLSQPEVENFIVAELEKLPGVYSAISSSALRSGLIADTYLNRMVINNFHPTRSGDIYVAFKPDVFVAQFDRLQVASTHSSHWRYDTHVPMVFSGKGISPGKVFRQVSPYDIAPTLSAVLGIGPPSGSTGSILEEIVE